MTSSVVQVNPGGRSAYVKLALQVLADCIAVSMIVFVSVVLTGESPTGGFRTLFAAVWLYTALIAVPAHLALPHILSFVTEKRPTVQWAVLLAGLIAFSIGGGLAGSVIVFALDLYPGVSLQELVWLTTKLAMYLALLVGIIHALVELLLRRLTIAEANLRAREIAYERERKLAAEARLAALESRVHPHFIFNALNTVSSLIPTAPERAERLIERISALLRFSLDAHQDGLVPLKREMKIVRDFLDIEQARFGERLRYTLDVSPQAGESGVPPLSVQTLAENCVKHAVAPARDGAEIRIRALSEHDAVHIEVADTGPGFSMADVSAGHGLDNLRSRLTVLFACPEPLQVARADGWTTVSFRVPA